VSRSVIRLFTVSGVAAAVVGLTALPALAHVSVSSPGATQGGFGVLTFQMPNETDNANATELKVQLPADQPLASVSVKPQPGWSYTVTRAKLSQPITDDDGNQVTDYPSVVDWKATAGGIKPGEYAEFSLSVGPLPKADSMTFKAIQSYSNGETVSWIEEPAAGSNQEPEHPAPTLKLAPASDTGTAAPTTTNTAAPPAAASDEGASTGSVTGAYVVGGIGLVAGLAALALALSGRRRRAAAESARERVGTGT
jgi:periplasmic copper chaperone A